MKKTLSMLLAVIFTLTAFGMTTLFGGVLGASAVFFDYYEYISIPGFTAFTEAEMANAWTTAGNFSGFSSDYLPAGSDVELALLAVDTRDRPLRLLGSLRLDGTGTALPFRLTFNPEAFPRDLRVELRARVSQSGQLIQRLAPRRIPAAESQSLGALQLETVP